MTECVPARGLQIPGGEPFSFDRRVAGTNPEMN